jgi:protease PrsW
VAFVTYAFGHARRVVTAQRIFTAFVYGGVLGVLGAAQPGSAAARVADWLLIVGLLVTVVAMTVKGHDS